jgi:hypothetical protein
MNLFGIVFLFLSSGNFGHFICGVFEALATVVLVVNDTRGHIRNFKQPLKF